MSPRITRPMKQAIRPGCIDSCTALAWNYVQAERGNRGKLPYKTEFIRYGSLNLKQGNQGRFSSAKSLTRVLSICPLTASMTSTLSAPRHMSTQESVSDFVFFPPSLRII